MERFLKQDLNPAYKRGSRVVPQPNDEVLYKLLSIPDNKGMPDEAVNGCLRLREFFILRYLFELQSYIPHVIYC